MGDFWQRVAQHEARGVPRAVALRAAKIMEARPPTIPWDERLHHRNVLGRFIPMDDKGHPVEPRSAVGSRFPAMTPKQLHRMLVKAGFKRTGQKGSHAVFEHPERGRKVIVPMHGNRSIPRGTLMSIITSALTPSAAYA